eukprot:403341564
MILENSMNLSRQLDVIYSQFYDLSRYIGTNETTLISALGAFIACMVITLTVMTLYMTYRVYKLGKKQYTQKNEKQAISEKQQKYLEKDIENQQNIEIEVHTDLKSSQNLKLSASRLRESEKNLKQSGMLQKSQANHLVQSQISQNRKKEDQVVAYNGVNQQEELSLEIQESQDDGDEYLDQETHQTQAQKQKQRSQQNNIKIIDKKENSQNSASNSRKQEEVVSNIVVGANSSNNLGVQSLSKIGKQNVSQQNIHISAIDESEEFDPDMQSQASKSEVNSSRQNYTEEEFSHQSDEEDEDFVPQIVSHDIITRSQNQQNSTDLAKNQLKNQSNKDVIIIDQDKVHELESEEEEGGDHQQTQFRQYQYWVENFKYLEKFNATD